MTTPPCELSWPTCSRTACPILARRATAAAEWLARSTPPVVPSNAQIPNQQHVVSLQTDCLLTDPDVLRARGLFQAYSDYWTDVSGGSLELVRFFASQSLRGGHLYRRTGRGPYEPFFVTDRGSVFVLKAIDQVMAGAHMQSWAKAGLPVIDRVKNRFTVRGVPLWKSCPFLPQVGYGEVMIDLHCHVGNRAAMEVSS